MVIRLPCFVEWSCTGVKRMAQFFHKSTHRIRSNQCCDVSWNWWKFWLITAYILMYFTFSIGLTFYQKWLIKDFPLPYPLTVVICHLIIKFALSALVRQLLECYHGVERTTLNWAPYLKQLSIVGIASALDIGLSNWSFQYITVSLYTMTKSTCIVFILMFAVIFKLETLRFSLVIIVLLISSGVFMFTYQSTQFHLFGFILVMSASLLGGLRWTVSQLVMQRKESGLRNPIDMMYHIQPWMILGILPLAIPMEGASVVTSPVMFRFHDNFVALQTAGLILTGSILAFLMEVCEFLLLTNTSSLTLSIVGIFKEIFTLYLGVNWNGDKLSFINKIGLVVSFIGIILHIVIKAFRERETQQITPIEKQTTDSFPLLNGLGSSNEEDGEDEEEIFDATREK